MQTVINTPDSKPVVLILGAAGRLGAALVQAFHQGGWLVRAQHRTETQRWPQGVQSIRCDALDASALNAAATGADVVIDALNAPYHQWAQLARPLADAARNCALSSGAFFMYPGNVYNFGHTLPEHLDEFTPQVANTPKAGIRIEIEREITESARMGMHGLIVRSGDFFGGGRGGWFDMVMVESLRKGRYTYPGPRTLDHAWAYLPDLARAYVALAEQRHQYRGIHTLCFPGHTCTGDQMHAEINALLVKRTAVKSVNWTLMRAVGLFSPMIRAVIPMRYLWLRAHRFEGQAFADNLPAFRHTSLRQALAQSLVALGMADLLHNQDSMTHLKIHSEHSTC